MKVYLMVSGVKYLVDVSPLYDGHSSVEIVGYVAEIDNYCFCWTETGHSIENALYKLKCKLEE